MADISLFLNAVDVQSERMAKQGFPQALSEKENDFRHRINRLKMNLISYLKTDGKELSTNLKQDQISVLIVVPEKLLSYKKQLDLIKPKINHGSIKLEEIRPWPYLKYLKNQQKEIYLILAVEIENEHSSSGKNTPKEWAKKFYYTYLNFDPKIKNKDKLRVGLNFEEGLILAWALLADKQYSKIRINKEIILTEASYLNPKADETQFNYMPSLQFTFGQFIVKIIETNKNSSYLGIATRNIKIITP